MVALEMLAPAERAAAVAQTQPDQILAQAGKAEMERQGLLLQFLAHQLLMLEEAEAGQQLQQQQAELVALAVVVMEQLQVLQQATALLAQQIRAAAVVVVHGLMAQALMDLQAAPVLLF